MCAEKCAIYVVQKNTFYLHTQYMYQEQKTPKKQSSQITQDDVPNTGNSVLSIKVILLYIRKIRKEVQMKVIDCVKAKGLIRMQ